MAEALFFLEILIKVNLTNGSYEITLELDDIIQNYFTFISSYKDKS